MSTGDTTSGGSSTGTASPYATGGGGVRLEHRVGALFLTWMLTERSMPELGGRVPAKVEFQQDSKTSVDDLVVTANGANGAPVVRLDVAVRRSPQFVRSHKKTVALVKALLAAEDDAARDDNALGVERRLAVASLTTHASVREVAALTDVARAQASPSDFFALVRTPGKFANRGRLEHLKEMVAAALPETDDTVIEERCWRLLQRLWIAPVRLQDPDTSDWSSIVDALRPMVADGTVEQATALRNHLEQLAGEFDPVAGSVDLRVLRRSLHGWLDEGKYTRPAGWDRLMQADAQARSSVAESITNMYGTSLTLPREETRERVRSAIAAAGDLIVRGDSGVGKSALVVSVLSRDAATGPVDRQCVMLNLRQLPSLDIELASLLGTPMVDLLGELTAPERVLVIDSTEAASEDSLDVLQGLIRAARASGTRLVAITTDEGASTVRTAMGVGSERPLEVQIYGLDDAELEAVATSLPPLRRLVDNPLAREVLRRPMSVDLLAKSADAGLPMSEAQALEHMWHSLVRNDEKSDHGAPAARERVMLALASHAMGGTDIDSLLDRLDDTAVDGLRRSGLLHPPSHLAWERVPTFRHDLIRSYAVARLLLVDRDPAASLAHYSAPRWALPSARLACEILLATPDLPGYPRAGRLSVLQGDFDALSTGGAGARWADVPVEAALSLPDSGDVLQDAWPALLDQDAAGIDRLLRVIRTRHQRGGLIDTAAVEPVVGLLTSTAPPRPVSKDASAVVSDWLRSHAAHGTPAGNRTRLAVRDAILGRHAEHEHAASVEDARIGYGWRSRSITDGEVEQLALLGPDLGPAAEALLRGVAETDPEALQHAVEPYFASNALAAHDRRLLIDLTKAYYIDKGDEADDPDEQELGWSSGLHEVGIREHQYEGLGAPLSAFYRGPFLTMFRTSYVEGVAALNRILDHAAQHRDAIVRNFRTGDDEPRESRALSITGEEREYAGDLQSWMWYRGTGAGPYPCMSALQALEVVSEELIAAGAAPARLAQIIVADARNLAAPALALAILVRHLSDVGDAIDPYLAEPLVWQLEFSRSTHEHASSLAARTPDMPHPERREWTLRHVAMELALRSPQERLDQLREVGNELQDRGRQHVGADESTEARQHLAVVSNWAAALDPASYAVVAEDNVHLVQQVTDPAVERELAAGNALLRRTGDAVGLVVRHAHVRDNGGRAPALDLATLHDDVKLAQDILENAPETFDYTADGAVAVGATALELHLTGQLDVPLDDLHWAAACLLGVSIGLTNRPPESFDDTMFAQGAERSAGRGSPYLLLPAAAEIRRVMTVDDTPDVNELIDCMRGVAARGDGETRLSFARALDEVWRTPCDFEHLYGRCHHEVAYELVVDSTIHTVVGGWDQGQQQRAVANLDPPQPASLDKLGGKEVYVRRLTAPLRSLGAAAASDACCAAQARSDLVSTLAAHQRGMLAMKHGHLHGRSDSLVAARAALQIAAGGHDDVVLDYVRGYLTSSRMLSEALDAINAAAEEQADRTETARRLWPQLMDLVLDHADSEPRIFTKHTWGEHARASLIPRPSGGSGYLTSELVGEPYRWRDLLGWEPQVERWLATGPAGRNSIDHLVIAVSELDVAVQVNTPLRWIERAVTSASEGSRTSTFMLSHWLRDRAVDLLRDEDSAAWRRVVDLLTVAGDNRVSDLAD